MKPLQKFWRRMAALAVCALCFATAALAAGVPGAVMDARESVVRVLCESSQYVGSGTGFAVSGNARYVVTNAHVVDGFDTVWVVHDGREIGARVDTFRPEKDLCILELDEALDAPGLVLLSGDVHIGQAVYALGYPSVSDELAGELLLNREDITVTDGIVSAVRDNAAMVNGAGSAQVVQTNAVINSGNSGGPLVDEKGRVVGVTTLSMLTGDNTYGNVHVNELRRVLDSAGVPYRKDHSLLWSVLFSALALAALAAAAVLAVRFVRRRSAGAQPRQPRQRAVPLSQFVRKGRALGDVQALRAVLGMLASGNAGGVSPDALWVDGTGVLRAGKAERWRSSAAYQSFYPPEQYDGGASDGGVYFWGAVLFTLTQGQLPPSSLARSRQPGPLIFPRATALQYLIEQAMSMQPARRPESTAALAAQLQALCRQLEAREQTAAAAPPAAAMAAQPAAAPAPAAVPAAAHVTAAAYATPVADPAAATAAPNAQDAQAAFPAPGAPQASAAPQPAPATPAAAQKPPRRPRSRLGKPVIAILCTACVLVLSAAGFLGYSGYHYGKMQQAMEHSHYDDAITHLNSAPWLASLQPQEAAYLNAYQLMDSMQMQAAYDAFKALGDYRDSADWAQKCYLYETASKSTLFVAFQRFSELGNFYDSAQQADVRARDILEYGLDAYASGSSFSSVRQYLDLIDDYPFDEETNLLIDDLIAICSAWETLYTENVISGTVTWKVRDALDTLEEMESYGYDVSDACMDRLVIDLFLEGVWYADDGDVFELNLTENWYSFAYDRGIIGPVYFEEDGMEAEDGSYPVRWEYIDFNTLRMRFSAGGSATYYRY